MLLNFIFQHSTLYALQALSEDIHRAIRNKADTNPATIVEDAAMKALRLIRRSVQAQGRELPPSLLDVLGIDGDEPECVQLRSHVYAA